MPKIHIVKQGEYLSGIARYYGFTDYLKIWDDPENADLKAKRKNPNVLFPGDRLSIPDKEIKEVSGSTEKRHRFQVKLKGLKLRLVLEDLYEKPIANAKCVLRVEGEDFELTTNGTGKLEQDIPPTSQSGELVVSDQQTPLNEISVPLKIGNLDPVDEVSGQLGRLNNLGYYAGPLPDNTEEDNKNMFQSAVEEFQCDHSLSVDGICGPNTQAKLLEVHGC
jgi:LysM repeat protein